MSRPYVLCYQDYVKRGIGPAFMEVVSHNLQNGFVFSTDAFFAAGHPSCKDEDSLEPDCWHIAAFWGDVSKLWDILPFPLPFVSWYKTKEGLDAKELHLYPLARLRGFTHG